MGNGQPQSRMKVNLLSQPNKDSSLNACVGNNGGPYDLAVYAEGFFQSGFAAIKVTQGYQIPIDVMVYPAVFSFRHGVELYIKHFLAELQKLTLNSTNYQKHHRLDDNWKMLTAVMAESRFEEYDLEKIETASFILSMLCDIDPTGQVFRYPEDNKGRQHLNSINIINIGVLELSMQTLFDVFQDWSRHIDVRWEYHFER